MRFIEKWGDNTNNDGEECSETVKKRGAFNTCTTQKLPMMKGEKMKICIDDSKKHRPVNIPNPYNVPGHC